MPAQQTEPVQACAQCGASIYQEHIAQGLAKEVDGKFVCSYCLAEPVAAEALAGSGEGESLALVEDSEGGDKQDKSPVHGFSGSGVAQNQLKGEYKRPLDPAGRVATRVRMFHARLSDGATRNMEDQVNGWLDANPDITIKFAETTVGTWEGKHSEPNLIMSVFY
jgi:hypothetical protein